MARSPGPDTAILSRPAADNSPAVRRVNITSAERAGGLTAIIAGVVLLTAAGSVLAMVLEALLVAAGLDLAITGALGHRPLYQKLGYLPRSLRSLR